jgi:hypothetical protein
MKLRWSWRIKKSLGYPTGATIFGGGNDALVCIPNASETTIVKNVVRNIGFLKIEHELCKLKKHKIAQCLAHMNIKVNIFLLFECFHEDVTS